MDYPALLKQIAEKSGIPIVINTSDGSSHIDFPDVATAVNALESLRQELDAHMLETLDRLRRLDSLIHGGN